MTSFRMLATAVAVAALTGPLLAQNAPMPAPAPSAMPAGARIADGAKRVRITVENMTTGQAFAPSVFMAHDGSAPPLYKDGEKASFGLMRLAEEGNTGPLLAEAGKMMGKGVGQSVTALPVPPGMKSATIEIEVTREHPMISGAFMLGMTNDGFTGISGVNAYEMTEAKTMDLMAWEAGTERNNETKAHLIALMGTERDPEGGVVQKHAGIKGNADAPDAWKFDPLKPVGRITIAPATATR